VALYTPPVKQIIHVPALPQRPTAGHKGTFGTLSLLAGSEGMLGAAILAARGALRGGVGLCRVCLPEALMSPFTVAVPAATTVPRTETLHGFLDESTAVVVGPGLGTAAIAGEQVRLVMRDSPGPIVLDADGLNLVAPLGGSLTAAAPLVLTPHPGEAARLLQSDAAAVMHDRVAAAGELAMTCGQVVVLKGQGTLVCDGDRLFRNRTGNSGLATGGTGDVLAGLIGALLCQGMEPFDAACLGVHVHGAAGDLVASRLSVAGLCAEDLPLAIAEVMR
jgi:hydroxyethylthiazole kinase-like uncharacterized protein yjeF